MIDGDTVGLQTPGRLALAVRWAASRVAASTTWLQQQPQLCCSSNNLVAAAGSTHPARAGADAPRPGDPADRAPDTGTRPGPPRGTDAPPAAFRWRTRSGDGSAAVAGCLRRPRGTSLFLLFNKKTLIRLEFVFYQLMGS